MGKGLVLVALFFALPAHAKYNAEFARFLEKEITAMENAVNRAPQGPPQLVKRPLDAAVESTEGPLEGIAGQETWYLQNFWIRIRARGGIAIPEIVRVEIVPEVELLWQRPRPQGWDPYQP